MQHLVIGSDWFVVTFSSLSCHSGQVSMPEAGFRCLPKIGGLKAQTLEWLAVVSLEAGSVLPGWFGEWDQPLFEAQLVRVEGEGAAAVLELLVVLQAD